MFIQIKLRNCFKFIILFGFVYQLFDSINDFLKFNELIELNFGNDDRMMPSITICLDERYKTENVTYKIYCYY